MILSLILVLLSCSTLSISAMDPIKMWRAAQNTNQNWQRIVQSLQAVSDNAINSNTVPNLKANEQKSSQSPLKPSSSVKGKHEQK